LRLTNIVQFGITLHNEREDGRGLNEKEVSVKHVQHIKPRGAQKKSIKTHKKAKKLKKQTQPTHNSPLPQKQPPNSWSKLTFSSEKHCLSHGICKSVIITVSYELPF